MLRTRTDDLQKDSDEADDASKAWALRTRGASMKS